MQPMKLLLLLLVVIASACVTTQESQRKDLLPSEMESQVEHSVALEKTFGDAAEAFAEGDGERAVKGLRQCLAESPKNVFCAYDLAVILHQEGQDNDPIFNENAIAKTYLAIENRQKVQALNYAQSLVESSDNNVVAMILLARAYELSSNRHAANHILKQLAEKLPNSAYVQYLLGKNLQASGDLISAKKAYEQAIAKAKTSKLHYVEALGVVNYLLGDFVAAKANFLSVHSAKPDSTVSNAYLVALYVHAGEYSEAKKLHLDHANLSGADAAALLNAGVLAILAEESDPDLNTLKEVQGYLSKANSVLKSKNLKKRSLRYLKYVEQKIKLKEKAMKKAGSKK